MLCTGVREFNLTNHVARGQLEGMWRSWLGLGRCWGCGTMLLANEVAGTCPGCRLAWPVLPPDASSQALGQLRAGRSSLGLGVPLVRRSRHLASPAPNEVRRLGRPCQMAWALDGRDLATSTPRHGACSCAFALAQAASAGVQPRGIAGAWLVPHVGVFG